MKRFSKHLSVILALAVVLSCLFLQTVSAAPSVWDGSVYGGAIAGGGSEEDPYLITNAEQLAWIISNGGNGHYYRLTADLYLNDVSKVDWSTGEAIGDYTPRSWYKSSDVPAFSGVIDGNGFVIYGLYYKDSTERGSRTTGYGLIPEGGKVTIKNLGIDKSYLEAYTNYSLGAFIGLGQGILSGMIDCCYSGAEVTVKGYDAGSITGGGDIARTLTIQNTYSLATVNGSHLSGMVGDIWTDEYVFKDCYAVGTKLVGKGIPTVSRAYSTEEKSGGELMSAADMKGTAISGNKLVLSDAFVATASYPVLKPFCDSAKYSWNEMLHGFESGSGTANDPYLIEDAGQLALAVKNGGGNYKLTKDIFINDIEKINWATGAVKENASYTPNNWFYGDNDASSSYFVDGANLQFKGTIDGNGFSVHGLWYSSENVHTAVGLVPAAVSSTLKNITLSNSYIYGGRFTGGLSSYFGGTMSGCIADESVMVCGIDADNYESESIGGLVGWGQGITLTDCGFSGILKKVGTGGHHIYGLVGTSWGTKVTAENCYSIGYQPFTTSVGAKNYTTQAEAEAGYNNLYKATNCYTDTYAKDNKVSYKYDSDGKDTNGDGKLEYDKSATYTVFSFGKLSFNQIKSKEALDYMTGFSADKWNTREALPPIQTAFIKAHGDVDGDGKFAEYADIIALRNNIIGQTAAPAYPDVNLDGNINVCDLVAISKLDRFAVGSLTVPTAVFFDDFTFGNTVRIIYPAGDSAAYQVAKNLAAYYDEAGVAASVFDDSTETAENEILLGKTNRAESKDIALNGYASEIVNGKLVIYAGHSIALEEAVNTVISVPFRKNAAPVFSGCGEFDSTVTLSSGNTYSYVWGDEFIGDSLNRDKWVCSTSKSKMQGFSDMPILDTEEVVKVTDGRLRLSAIPYSIPGNDQVKYAVPASVHSQGTMEYRYGYAEIRAKVPFEKGVWPSFWMQSNAVLGGRKCNDYFVEVDVFEIFGTEGSVVPNLHKWYRPSHDSSTHDCTYTGTHTSSGTDKTFVFSNTKTLDYEYHTYGFEWTPEKMSMYVDGYCYKTYDITKSYDACSDVSGFNDPMFFIFNNHLFSPESSFKPNLITDNESIIPAHYELDYFRLYQSDKIANTDIWTK